MLTGGMKQLIRNHAGGMILSPAYDAGYIEEDLRRRNLEKPNAL